MRDETRKNLIDILQAAAEVQKDFKELLELFNAHKVEYLLSKEPRVPELPEVAS